VRAHLLNVALAAALAAGCQDDISTPFPEGLEPLEDNRVAAQPDGPFEEVLRIESSDTDLIRVHARGFVLAPPAELWAATKIPDANVSTCSTTEHVITPDNEPQYEASFLIHYIVRSFLTVEWDDQWRFGWIMNKTELGTTELGMIKHQKVEGSEFVVFNAGTIQVLPTADPGISELAFVEHLDAVAATEADVVEGIQHNYDALVATVHGKPIPACP
jgi:hypothetical protein